MVTIKGTAEGLITVKKSRFLGLACRAETEADALQVIEERKRRHRDARHNCFAWILENGEMRYTDDGEPQGTAGIPILEVIKNSGLTDALVIVTRYFGGTLLGAPGLARAYAQCASQTLASAAKIRITAYNAYDCVFDFATFSRAQFPLCAAGCIIDEITYGGDVRAKLYISPEKSEIILKQIGDLTSGRTVPIPAGTKRITSNV